MLASNRNMKLVRGAAIAAMFAAFLCGALLLLAGKALAGAPAGNEDAAQSSPGTQPAKPDAPDCGPNWVIVDESHPGSEPRLNGVAAVSSSSVWAVGSYVDPNRGQYSTLTEHWNGSTLNMVPSPNAGNLAANYLFAVTAVGPGDVWAVGDFQSNSDNMHTLTEHWDGSAWTIIPSPSPSSSYDNVLRAATAVSSNDVWAVGDIEDQYFVPYFTLIEHWNGSTWNVVNGVNPGFPNNALDGITAISASNIWAVGWYLIGSSEYTLTEHWNGNTWSQVPSVSPSSNGTNVLYRVAAVSANNLWAVGTYGYSAFHTLIEHWDGSTWSRVASPDPGSGDNQLWAITVAAANNVWAVGYARDSNSGLYYTLVEHWDGNAWSHVGSPNPPAHQVFLDGVAAASGNDVWATGYWQDAAGGWNVLVERYNPCATSTPTRTPTHRPTNTPTHRPTRTPLPTQTPGGPTATPIPSDTAGPQPTSCSVQYSDVPPGSTFYSYIHCLACLGIVNSYADGTFKPNNPVTRGQLSKIVSNSAGYSETHLQRTFEDVPPNSTFYQFIERLATRGYISGYSCGGTNEPCVPPANLPYFRPNANVTRGQTSKIVASASGLPAPPPNQHTFQDVPVGSTFWQWIEELAATGAIGGYPCGGANEPCVPPGNLPYFRPNNIVTRGQSAKIVANTFFPNCQAP